jgi:amidase
VSAVEQRRLVETGAVSTAELQAAAVERIGSLDPLVDAVVCPLFDRPARGVPMLVKDAGQELAGTPHWVGVAALRDANARSTTTTGLVQQLEAGGFSVVGKGACPQLSIGASTEPPGFRPTRNPWDLSPSPGGSSGGPAAAVAAGMVPIAHGSDATGSLRCPAALCGLATLTPTAGRIPSTPPAGLPPNDRWRDFILTRHVEDLTWVFRTLTGSAPQRSSARLRVGVLDHDPELGLAVHPACQQAVAVAAQLLEALGHLVEWAWPEPLGHLWATTFEPFQILGDATRPAVLAWVTDRLGRPPAPGDLEAWFYEAVDRAGRRTADEVAIAQAAVEAAVNPIMDWWNDHDLLITPATFQPAWPLGTRAGPAQIGTLLAPFSLTGQPALSLPLHQSDEGLPIGVQVVGRLGADETLLSLAYDLQETADWTQRRPTLSP